MPDGSETPKATPAEQAVLKALDACEKRESLLDTKRRDLVRVMQEDLRDRLKADQRAFDNACRRGRALKDALDPAACQHTKTRAMTVSWNRLPDGPLHFHSGALECLACGARNFEIQTRWVHPEKERRARLEGKPT